MSAPLPTLTRAQLARERMAQAMGERCTSCRRRYLAHLDVIGGELDWTPCCTYGREAVEAVDFFGTLTHRERVQLLHLVTGGEVSEVLPALGGWVVLGEGLQIRPIAQRDAFEAIDAHHRHHRRPRGWKCGAAAWRGQQLVGVGILGRPVSRVLAARGWLEITRTCTWGGAQAHNAVSLLLAELTRRARGLGCGRILTYTLDDEAGRSLAAAGWTRAARTKGGSWNTPARPRLDQAPTCRKWRWEKILETR